MEARYESTSFWNYDCFAGPDDNNHSVSSAGMDHSGLPSYSVKIDLC
ncbi:MAG: hypothetical protein US98_C0029G0007 [Parcubacteria group bacterium GW2011_GWC1_38_6]|nr:MAG: hypothetical protein UR98_C0010G0002 [Parcubacteria group bacterium GW2011_GWA1_36_12]KKQ76690.1 MAG: hypothetical protein US98_C0029G0007 [Parcubacteria group bacterium GW2011_GWC1_38_6]